MYYTTSLRTEIRVYKIYYIIVIIILYYTSYTRVTSCILFITKVVFSIHNIYLQPTAAAALGSRLSIALRTL